MEKLRGGRQLLASLPLSRDILDQLSNLPSTPTEKYRKLSIPLLSFPLPKLESDHASKSLRIKAGETIRILDSEHQIVGLGALSTNKSADNCVYVDINSLEKHPPPFHRLLIGLPVQNTAEEIVESLTSIGTKSIAFYLANKSQNKTNLLEKNLTRLLKKRDVALKQSFATFSPDIKIFDSLLNGLSHYNLTPSKVSLVTANDSIMLEEHNCKIKNLKDCFEPVESLLIFGSEGGYSEGELDSLLQFETSFLSLGKNVLRLEIAASLALACYNCFSEFNYEMPIL